MKKINFVLVAFLLVSTSIQAQQIENGWYNFGKYITDNIGNTNMYGGPIFHSPSVVNESGGTIWRNALGQTFDPTDPTWDIVGNYAISENDDYLVDSISIVYKYFRPQNTNPDTLLVQVYIEDSMVVTNDEFGIGRSQAVPSYDNVNRKGTRAIQEFTVLLNEQDTQYVAPGRLNLEINQLVPAGQAIAVSYVYFPGNEINPGDTITNQLNNQPVNQRNTFITQTYMDNNNSSNYTYYNHSIFVDGGNVWPGYQNKFRAGIVGWEPALEYANMYFHIANSVGVNKLNTVNISVSPNPVADNFTIQGIDGNVQFEIYTLQGTKMLEGSTNGNDQINVSQLPAGTYLITVKNDKVSSNARILKM